MYPVIDVVSHVSNNSKRTILGTIYQDDVGAPRFVMEATRVHEM